MSLYAEAVAALSRWHPPTTGQRDLQRDFLVHLSEHADGLTRECHPDHITASALVVSHDRDRVLLNLHHRYRVWMQFGGHLESTDATLAAGALRETVEESGIGDLRLAGDAPVQLDRHEVQCGPVRPSHHLDVRFVVVAPPGAEPVVSDESLDVKWFDRDALPDGLERSVLELVAASRWL